MNHHTGAPKKLSLKKLFSFWRRCSAIPASSPEDAHHASEMSLGRLVAPSRVPLGVPPPVATRELLVGRARSRLSRLSELPCQLGKRGEINDCLASQFSSAPAGGQAS